PARREAGLVEDERARGIGYDAVTMADHEVTGGLGNVDAVVVVSGMAHDSFVFFVESVHGLPAAREACLQFARVGGQAGVLPRPAGWGGPARAGAVPGREPGIGVLGGVGRASQSV